jgi:glyoxylase-like metal-dependent hydrolase (beta-lactamase superfamily II)
VLPPLPQIEPLLLADMMLPDWHPLAGEQCVVLAFVIRHGDGAILVDTGVGGHAGIEKLYRPVRRPLAHALRDVGLGPEDVAAVVNTHLHFDHCGENALFPGVPIYVQRREYQAAQEPLYTVPEYVNAPGLAYQQVDGEREIANGVRLIPTPGHTPGHQAVLVEGRGKRAVIAGQAVYTASEYSESSEAVGSAGAWDVDLYAASATLLRKIEPVKVYFSHDRVIWEAGGGS